MTYGIIRYTQYSFSQPKMTPEQELEVARQFAAMGREAVLAQMPFVSPQAQRAFKRAMTTKAQFYWGGVAVVAAICVALWFAHLGTFMILVIAAPPRSHSTRRRPILRHRSTPAGSTR